MTLRVVIVDDEPLARRRLRRLLGAHADVELVGEAAGGDEAVGVVLRERPDLVLLDVRMPGPSGLEALRSLRAALPAEARPAAVFTTAFEEHALEAFELEVLDYLLKPVQPEHLARALERARAHRARPDADAPAPARAGDAGGCLAAHREGRIVNLSHDEIACVTAERGLTFAHAPKGRHRLRMTLGEAEQRLPSPPFVRVSRSALANLPWIEQLVPGDSGTYRALLRGPVGGALPVSRRRARELRRLLGW